ncbi:nucleoside hydrolase [Amycolatopsis suaedae]|uniref:Nucleoside hydrolase n=1 Tax=Amycolatopsis suaedae TaxID=2510978 RepID=A0A4Q7JB30_9PSEU|nr:nucleoside hydrolase [Amycolatopsis suaedae]RZQ64487.1 nucleoside hydrolase [Amycolatopsis suaedae]
MGTKLIIDTDPGVDDAFAIALAARSADVELLGLTTVYGNVPLEATTRNAQRLLALFGRKDVPVAAGAERPLVYPFPKPRDYAVHGEDGLGGSEGLPDPLRDIEPVDAVTMMVQLLEASDEPVTIAPIGPLTNIALLLAAHPGIREKIARLVIMGGAVAGGNISSAAEFNIWADPEAARRVLVEESVPTVLVPMDLTHRCAVDAPWLDSLAASGPVGAGLNALTTDYRAYYRTILGSEGMVMHDAVAVAEAISPGILQTQSWPIDVDCGFGPARGATIVDRRTPEAPDGGGRPPIPPTVDVAVDTDLDGLRTFVHDRIAGV